MILGMLLYGTLPTYHQQHFEVFGEVAPAYNQAILKGVDEIQSKVPTGGGYFIGVKAVPAECPIGIPLQLLGNPLLTPTRPTSYCSGASYSAFIASLNQILSASTKSLTPEQFEATRMQEPDGGRREDMVKLWGWWNADGPGSFYALTQYTKMGKRVAVGDAVSGDFCNINWVKGPGHSVVFLGWENTVDGQPGMRFWSSQKSTDGLGDLVVPVTSISGVVFTRLTDPEAIYEMNPSFQMERAKVEYDSVTPGFVATRIRERVGPLATILGRKKL